MSTAEAPHACRPALCPLVRRHLQPVNPDDAVSDSLCTAFKIIGVDHLRQDRHQARTRNLSSYETTNANQVPFQHTLQKCIKSGSASSSGTLLNVEICEPHANCATGKKKQLQSYSAPSYLIWENKISGGDVVVVGEHGSWCKIQQLQT